MFACLLFVDNSEAVAQPQPQAQPEALVPAAAQLSLPLLLTHTLTARPQAAAAFNYSHIIEAHSCEWRGQTGGPSPRAGSVFSCVPRSTYCFVHVKLLTRARHFEMFMRFHDQDEQLINPTRNYEYANVPASQQTSGQTDRRTDVQAAQRQQQPRGTTRCLRDWSVAVGRVGKRLHVAA